MRRGAADDRKTSLRASLDLSLAALDPPSPPHRLIRLMALLPDGMSEADSRAVLSGGEPSREERGAAARLETARLAHRAGGRWRLLAPVREVLLSYFPPESGDRARLEKLFLGRAALGKNAGWDNWRKVSDNLIPEAGNLDAMIGVALQESELPQGVSDAVRGLAELHIITGLASTASLPRAAKRFHNAGDWLSEANCFESLGDIASARSDHEEARRHYNTALPLYQQAGDVRGQANCVYGLGDVALARSDHEGARQHFEAALALYQQVGGVQGEANWIYGLGDIALARSDHEGARQRYEGALPLYQIDGDVVGEANCIYGLGGIALARSDHEGARQRYEAALPLYRQVGDVRREANCLESLGDVALRRTNHEEAHLRYEAALPLYQRIGDVLGEANCKRSLGDVEEAENNIPTARERWRQALALYARIAEPHSIHIRLARHAATPAGSRRAPRSRAQGLGVDRSDGPDRRVSREECVTAARRAFVRALPETARRDHTAQAPPKLGPIARDFFRIITCENQNLCYIRRAVRKGDASRRGACQEKGREKIIIGIVVTH